MTTAEAAAPERRAIEVPGGRTLDFLVGGEPDGLPLVVHNGTPAGLVFWPDSVAAARARGLRLIMIARPGYEGSTPRPGRRVGDVADDVAAVLGALGCDAFLTVGASGGGPHALACSVLLRGRCLAAATIAGVAPYRAEGLDWMAGMGPENVEEFGAALTGEAELTAYLKRAAGELSTVQGQDIIDAMAGLLPAADRAVLTPSFAAEMAASMRSALANGVAGWRDDDLAFTTGWGFPLDQAGPVAVWQGTDDLMVPEAHGAWLAHSLPAARLHLLPGEGHLNRQGPGFTEVLDDLIALAGL